MSIVGKCLSVDDQHTITIHYRLILTNFGETLHLNMFMLENLMQAIYI